MWGNLELFFHETREKVASEGLPAGFLQERLERPFQQENAGSPTVCDDLQGRPGSNTLSRHRRGNRAEVVDSLMRSWQKTQPTDDAGEIQEK